MDDTLFFQVWRNKYLNFEIFRHIRLFNNNLHVQEFTIETLENYKYKEYLKSILILDCHEDEKIAKLNKILERLSNITSLASSKDFNRELPQQEFTKLETVTFGGHFNSGFVCCTLPVICIASSLVSLHFGDDFNQSIDLILLTNLKNLSFGASFNRTIKPGQLPPSLRYLRLGSHFNQELSIGTIPKDLDTLILGTCYNKRLFQKIKANGSASSSSGSGNIISRIISKAFHSKSTSCCKDDLPQIKHLEFGDYFNIPLKNIRLPTSIKYLKFGSNFNQRSFTSTSSITKLINLQDLIFGNLFNHNINYLPASLVNLELSFHFNSIITPESIPPTLEKITLGYMYNRNLSFLKNSNVKTIILSTAFNQPLYTDLNSINNDDDDDDDNGEVKYKKSGKSNKKDIVNEIKSDLPASLTYLDLSNSTRFDQEFGNTLLHTNLITLKLHKNYKKLIDINQLPKSLNDLQCHLHLNFHYFLKHSNILSLSTLVSPSSSNISSPSSSPPPPLSLNGYDSLSTSTSSSFSASSSILDSQIINCSSRNITSSLSSISPSSLETQQLITTSSLLPISKITFDKSFNQVIPPNSIKSNYLKTIDFRFVYNIPFVIRAGSIPEGVENVAFNIVNIKFLKGILPSSVKNLYITSYDINPIIDSNLLPDSIENIFIKHSAAPLQFKSIYSIPSKLRYILCYNTNKSFIQYCLNHNFLYNYLKIIDYKSYKDQLL